MAEKREVWVLEDVTTGAPIGGYVHPPVEAPGLRSVRYVPVGAGEISEGDAVRRLTSAMREADQAFERVGGSTRHHVRDCLMPALEKEGLAVVDAEQRGRSEAEGWVALLDSDNLLTVNEGESYWFAVQVSTNGNPPHWEYFSDAIVWDSETEADWSDGAHGWGIDDVHWYRPLPPPPVPSEVER